MSSLPQGVAVLAQKEVRQKHMSLNLLLWYQDGASTNMAAYALFRHQKYANHADTKTHVLANPPVYRQELQLPFRQRHHGER